MAGILITLVLYVFTILLAALILFYIYVKSAYKYFNKKGIPYDIPTFPFGSFTSSVLLKKSFSHVLAEIYLNNKRHKLVGFFSFWKSQVLITDPEVLKHVLVKDFDVFENRGIYFNKLKDPLSAHLFALHGKEWKNLRAKMTPTFTSGKIKGMFPNIVVCAKAMVDYAENAMASRNKVNCTPLFSRYGLAVIANIAFGLDSDALTNENSTFVKMAYMMVEPTVERLITNLIMFNEQIATMLDMRVVPRPVSEYFLGMVSNTIKFRETNGVARNDYLQLLLQIKESGIKDSEGFGYSFSDEELAAQSFVFILAGSETTSATISFCLYELALNPEVQQRLAVELDSLTELTYDNICSLQYLDMVVDETLRKYPPLAFLNRLCERDYLVPGTQTVIEKGTQVYVSVQGLHNDPDLFPEPDRFIPERFSKDNRDNIKPYTYMPFGEGPRYCIGMRFGRVTVKTALAMLLRRFQVHLCPEVSVPAKIEPRTVITLPAGGMWLELKPRTLA